MWTVLKMISTGLILILLVAVIFWSPYRTQPVPAWKAQVLDMNGRPLSGVQANEEWIDPREDGIIRSDSRVTGLDGWVVFPQRESRNRLALRWLNHHSAPSAHIFVCWNEQTGDVFWEANQKPPARLRLKRGFCPYG